MTVSKGDDLIGEITSGCVSPTLGHPIAMAYVTANAATVGDPLKVDMKGKLTDAEVVALPFYKR